MAHRRVVQTTVGCAVIWLLAGHLEAIHQSPLEVLTNEFVAAAPTRDDRVLGAWILVLNINSERFLTGRSGADNVLEDPRGIRDKNLGNRAYWELVIERRSNGALQARSRTT
jgi:hypothetical protein